MKCKFLQFGRRINLIFLFLKTKVGPGSQVSSPTANGRHGDIPVAIRLGVNSTSPALFGASTPCAAPSQAALKNLRRETTHTRYAARPCVLKIAKKKRGTKSTQNVLPSVLLALFTKNSHATAPCRWSSPPKSSSRRRYLGCTRPGTPSSPPELKSPASGFRR